MAVRVAAHQGYRSDTASIDYGQSTGYESHPTLYEHDIPAFENFATLDRLLAKGATWSRYR